MDAARVPVRDVLPHIVVVGVGYVGLPAAVMWAKAGLSVTGVDIDPSIVEGINNGRHHVTGGELDRMLSDPAVRDHLVGSATPVAGDAFIVAVPTPVDYLTKRPDLGAVEAAVRSICPVLTRGNLVVIESTIPPLTTSGLVKELIERETGLKVPEDILLAHCPERILPGAIEHEIVHNDRLIGGIDDASTQAATDLYATFVKGALIPTSATAAETAKIMENASRDVGIALANECALICEKVGVDASEVIALANRHPRVNILSPGIGVGGHCIPVDPWFLVDVAPAETRLLRAARVVNDEMPKRAATRVRTALNGKRGARVVALGAAYKRECDDVREAPARDVVRLLQATGITVEQYDPLVPGMGYASLAEVAKGADLVIILVHHARIDDDIAAAGGDLPPVLDLDPR
ncbi:UDP-N-acetyl-D-mannosaminuronic acid dehydrogenase [Sphingomonas jatrophae]|uniref:UDP-N-acetyl-D-mannosaminuronic acid dehydrogenase n=1 Tax=Sphingomonas jatrophae TaxID=1166337 RepID=A0A1I6L3S9_9SPHN|nr:UDP-N-acetyl-D-mannosaminuronic acid dehydrogenase [Sphingomonas jatrophae]